MTQPPENRSPSEEERDRLAEDHGYEDGDVAFKAGWDARDARIQELEELLGQAEEAFEYIACDGIDDADVYSDDDLPPKAIAMMNRARSALTAIRAAKTHKSE